MKASIKQISEITGFSPATISNALNHKKGVNQKTAERIFQVAKEIGYISENKITKIKTSRIISTSFYFMLFFNTSL